MSMHEILWTPDRTRAERSQMHEFIARMAGRYGFTADYRSAHLWSVEHRDQFWKEMWEFAGIRKSKNESSICTGDGMLGTKWFPGLEFNFAQHMLRFNDDRVAIQAADELDRSRILTYRDLNVLVGRCAAAMRAMGIVKGDRVAAFMPNVPETVIAMLAAASIGALFSSCSPDFGVQGVLDRFGQIQPKILVAADGYSYNGKTIDTLERARDIVSKIPSIERAVIVSFMRESPNIGSIRNATSWDEFLGTASQHAGSRDSERNEIRFEPVPFDHPLYIMYSSGTTGVPKCIIHGQGGTLLQHMKELMLHCDLRRDDTILYFTTCGWMMWNWLVSSLGVGATVVLYEGSPAYPGANHLWRLAEKLGISVFGTSPKFLSACEKADLRPGEKADLTRLRALLSTGSPLTVENFKWVYANVKRDLQVSSICGGTDIISCFMLGSPTLSVRAGEIQCVGLGMDLKAFDDSGRPVIGEKGELVCCSPFPSQPVGFWNDPDGSKYRGAYFEHFPGIWRHGDFVEISPEGGVIVFGRSDATLNPAGVRIGTAEIYRQVESIPEIVDSVVVGKDTADADVEICLFVVLREGCHLSADLEYAIRNRIAQGTTKRHVPKYIKQVTGVPYTISGKKVEMAVQRILNGLPVPNLDALANPEVLKQYTTALASK